MASWQLPLWGSRRVVSGLAIACCALAIGSGCVAAQEPKERPAVSKSEREKTKSRPPSINSIPVKCGPESDGCRVVDGECTNGREQNRCRFRAADE